MNKIYDKLFLVLALLLLLGSSAFYFLNLGSGAQSTGASPLADHAYAPIEVQAVSGESVNWPKPKEQSTGWIYDVFTPPKIYLDENGQFVNKGWKIMEEIPFGIYLADLARKPYRIQLEGYIEDDLTDASKSLLLLYDEEAERSVRARVGSTQASSEFEVIDFKIDRLRDKNGNPYKEIYATILDQRTGEQVILRNDERLYQEGVTIRIRSEQNPEVDVTATEVGATFETPAGSYVIEALSIDEMAITVKKLAVGERDAEVKRLMISEQSKVSPESENEPEVLSTGEAFDAFDTMF